MPKRTTMTAAEVEGAVEKAQELSELAVAIAAAVNKGEMDLLPDPEGVARKLVAAARDLNQAALTLFIHRDSANRQAMLDELRKRK